MGVSEGPLSLRAHLLQNPALFHGPNISTFLLAPCNTWLLPSTGTQHRPHALTARQRPLTLLYYYTGTQAAARSYTVTENRT